MLNKNKYFSYEKSYHYNNEYPLEIFIKNTQKTKKEKNTQNINIKQERRMQTTQLGDEVINKRIKKCRLYEKLLNSYYTNYKYLHEEEKYENNNTCIIDKLSKNIRNIIYFNSEIVYEYYEIFKNFINNNIKDKYDVFDMNKELYILFKDYIKNNEGIKMKLIRNNITVYMFYKDAFICYRTVSYIIKDNKEFDSKNIVKLFSMTEININIIHKLSKHDDGSYFRKFLKFLKDKHKKLIEDEKNDYSRNIIYDNITNYNCKLDKQDEQSIKNLIKNIPIYYLGSKKNIVNIILHKIKEINNNRFINTYIELFGGSLCMSYVLKNLNPNLNVIVYENNNLLMNFYESLKSKYSSFIDVLVKNVNKIDNVKNKVEYIRNMINNINNALKNKIKIDKITLACYYYIINKLAFRGIIKYNKNREINITIDKTKIKALLNFNNKQKNILYGFSTFLKSIQIKNIDIVNNYDIIYKDITPNTFLYLDPPYDSINNEYSNYQDIFDNNSHISLNMFLDRLYEKNIPWIKSNRYTGFILDLYSRYKKIIINVRNRINNSFRSDLLITSF